MFRNITRNQESILIGSILGDSNINKSGGITFVASKKHIDYLEWKYRHLRALLPSKIQIRSQYHQKYKTVYTVGTFYLGKSIGAIARRTFYPKGTKIIPKHLVFSKMAIAIWMLDDGSLVNRSSFMIAANAFDSTSIERARKMLSVLGIKSCSRDRARRIAVPAKSARIIGKWMLPIVKECPSMAHKVDLRNQQIEVPKVRIICQACGKVFYAYKSNHQQACSRVCGDKIKRRGYATRKTKMKCPRCHKQFVRYNKRQSHCLKCRKLRTKALPCVICGKAVWHKGRRACSRSCGVALGHHSRK